MDHSSASRDRRISISTETDICPQAEKLRYGLAHVCRQIFGFAEEKIKPRSRRLVSDWSLPCAVRCAMVGDMNRASKPRAKKRQTEDRPKLSLYGLSVEDALRAAAKTGRPPPLPERPKRQRKKKTDPKLGC